MLNESDTEWLMQQIAATAELLGQAMGPAAVAMMAGDLAGYPRHVLAAALQRVRTEHTGKLTPKVVIDAIDAVMGRPGGNEAWAIALTALDERNTVVWTDEMAQAWDVARPLVARGDGIGGRMAFKETYDRLVRAARDERRTPVISLSEGWDGRLRVEAVAKAIKLGYMPPDAAAARLTAPKASIDRLLALAGNYSGSNADSMPPKVRAQLLALRDEMATANVRRAAEQEKRAIIAAADLAASKLVVQQRIDEYTKKLKEGLIEKAREQYLPTVDEYVGQQISDVLHGKVSAQ